MQPSWQVFALAGFLAHHFVLWVTKRSVVVKLLVSNMTRLFPRTGVCRVVPKSSCNVPFVCFSTRFGLHNIIMLSKICVESAFAV